MKRKKAKKKKTAKRAKKAKKKTSKKAVATNALREGTAAPAFSLPATDSQNFSLKDLKGKNVVLYFYPKDLTSGCTQEACDFQKALPRFKKKNTIILGVSKDSVQTHEKFRMKYGLDFPLLADTEGKVCEKYRVWKEKSMYGRKYMGIERSTFVIGKDGKIKRVFPKVKVNGHVEEVLESI